MEGTLEYLRGLKDRLDCSHECDKSEELQLMVQNAFQEIDGMEFRLACHHDGSVLVEKLLRLATEFEVRVFWDRVSGCAERMACHRYASHVMETLLVRSSEVSGGAAQDDVGESVGVLLSLADLVSRFEQEMLSVIDALLDSSYASHVLRVYIDRFAPSGEFTDAIIAKCSWTSPTAAPVLQSVFKKVPIGTAKAVPSGLSRQTFIKYATDKIGSRTCEAFVEMLPKVSSEEYTSFYQAFIRGDTLRLAQDEKRGSFVVQCLISSCPTESLYLVVLEELSGATSISKGGGHSTGMGLMFKIINWPVVHGRAFGRAMAFFNDTLHLKTPGEKQSAVNTLLSSAIGTSTLALFAKYPPELNRYITDGLLDLSSEQLRDLALDKTAAHCLEAFLSPASSTLSAKARNKLARRLSAHAGQLAVSPAGSYVVEAAFRAASLQLKEAIAGELSASRKRLEDAACGRIILKRCCVEEYERRRDEWLARYSQSTKRSFLDDILNDDDNNDNNNGAIKKSKRQ